MIAVSYRDKAVSETSLANAMMPQLQAKNTTINEDAWANLSLHPESSNTENAQNNED